MSRKVTLVSEISKDSEIESGLKRIYKINELVKFASIAWCCTEAVIDETAKKLWSRAIELIVEDLFFYVTHEKVSIVGIHFVTHGHAIGLRIKFPGERKAVKGEHKFS